MTNQIFGAFSEDSKDPRSRISQANSSISLDPFIGCPLHCAYCYRHNSKRDIEQNTPNQIFSEKEMVNSLVKVPNFIPDKSVISIDTATTDPFLPQTIEGTFGLMENLVDRGLKNPFWIVTKIGIPEDSAKRFRYITDRNRGIVLSICYSDMPKRIEPYSGDRFRNIEEGRKGGLKISLHYRPIVKGWNDSCESIRKVLSEAKKRKVDCVCVGGLRYLQGIKYSVVKLYHQEFPDIKENELEKEMPQDIENNVFSIAKKINLGVPIYLHASCAISHLLGFPDYNATFIRYKMDCEASECTAQDRGKCKVLKEKLLGDKSYAPKSLGIESNLVIAGDGYHFSKELTYEEHRGCIHRTCWDNIE